jgi:FkbM family methyltransferase
LIKEKEKEKDIYIIQVGSHIGDTCNDFLYNNIKLNRKYIMIEPVPYLFNQLKENYKSYNNIIFLNIAISNYNGFIDLYVPSEKNDFTKLVRWTSQLASTNKEHISTFVPEAIVDKIVDKIVVECKSLNTLIKEYNIKDFEYLYTDTEGHDYDILMDLELSLIRPKNIIFENKHMDGPKYILDINNCPNYFNLLDHFKKYGYEIETQTEENTHIKLFKTVNIEHDIWTCSEKMRYDIYDFFKDKTHLKIAEIGSHKGYSTKVLSKIFSKVYAVDNSIEWTNFNKNFNKDATNIEYVMLDIYKDSWEILPDDIELSFIDAGHSYECCKSDILNSIKQFKNLQYIIFDDYGVWSGVKQIIDELINNKTLKFERFIGLNDVPGPNGIVKNINEGVICSINKIINKIINKTYTWGNSQIKFLDNYKMDAFGEGNYKFIDKQNIIANFGGREHSIKFNIDYTEFSSTRKDDLQIVNGKVNPRLVSRWQSYTGDYNREAALAPIDGLLYPTLNVLTNQ